jgi:hypothetical protein
MQDYTIRTFDEAVMARSGSPAFESRDARSEMAALTMRKRSGRRWIELEGRADVQRKNPVFKHRQWIYLDFSDLSVLMG